MAREDRQCQGTLNDIFTLPHTPTAGVNALFILIRVVIYLFESIHAQGRLHPTLVSPDGAGVIEIAREHGAISQEINSAGGESGTVTLLTGVFMINCPICNTPNEPDYTFCMNCGQPLNLAAPAEQSTTTPAGNQIEAPSAVAAEPTPTNVSPVQPAASAPPPGAYQPAAAQTAQVPAAPSYAPSTPAGPGQPLILASTPAGLLGMLTLRLVIVLLGLWLARLILIWLPFTKGLVVPEVNIPIPTLVTSIIYLLVVAALVGYARTVWVIWPQAFPRMRDATLAVICLIYLGVLVAVFYAVQPLLVAANSDEAILTGFQAILFLIAVFLVSAAGYTTYQRLPAWLAIWRQGMIESFASAQVACLHCGRLNSLGATHCQYCGNPVGANQPPRA